MNYGFMKMGKHWRTWETILGYGMTQKEIKAMAKTTYKKTAYTFSAKKIREIIEMESVLDAPSDFMSEIYEFIQLTLKIDENGDIQNRLLY